MECFSGKCNVGMAYKSRGVKDNRARYKKVLHCCRTFLISLISKQLEIMSTSLMEILGRDSLEIGLVYYLTGA